MKFYFILFLELQMLIKSTPQNTYFSGEAIPFLRLCILLYVFALHKSREVCFLFQKN